MFNDARDRGSLERNASQMRADTQRWDNEGGLAAREQLPQLQPYENAFRAATHLARRRRLARTPRYVPAMLAQLKLRQSR